LPPIARYPVGCPQILGYSADLQAPVSARATARSGQRLRQPPLSSFI
jgi:hypothetical protein